MKPNFKYSCEYCLHFFFASALAIVSRNKAQLRSLPCVASITRGRCHTDVHPKQLCTIYHLACTKIAFTNSSDVTKDAKNI
ncbi:hypothetical protein T07_4412 [Trichinella nelsoni]|uniref:Uncharacterized protein n=1 Tax=Trichinella nelsoni TaxID=6336 RepID=A0A0V0RF16_9BILA|nr:hypothetical protein T07_4412 [Trichinella nelsoni]